MTLSKAAQGHSEMKSLMVVDYGRYPITGRIVKSFMSLTRDDQAHRSDQSICFIHSIRQSWFYYIKRRFIALK